MENAQKSNLDDLMQVLRLNFQIFSENAALFTLTLTQQMISGAINEDKMQPFPIETTGVSLRLWRDLTDEQKSGDVSFQTGTYAIPSQDDAQIADRTT